MAKIQISPEGFIAEANRKLRAEPGSKEGIEFLPFPEGAVDRGATGYQYKGEWDPAYQRAWDKTGEEYEISGDAISDEKKEQVTDTRSQLPSHGQLSPK